MTIKHSINHSLKVIRLIACASIALAFSAKAVQFTWDSNGASAGTGGSGDWDTTTLNWDDGANAWPGTGTDNDALFGGSAGTVTVQGSGIAVNDISFTTTGYTIQGSLVTITNTALWTVDDDVHAVFTTPIQQTMFPFTKTGRGTLEFASGCATWNAGDDNQLFNITNGTLLVSGGIFGVTTGSARIRIGSGFGAMRQTGGIAHFGNNDGQWMVGTGNVYGYYGLEGGTLTSTNGASSANFRFAVRTGSMVQSGGEIVLNLGPSSKNQSFTIGTDSSAAAGGATVYSTNGTAYIAVSSGVTQQGIGVGARLGSNGGGYGQLTLESSADWNNAGYTQVGYPGDFSGSVNLLGNSRLTSSYLSGAINGFLSFNGGTLRANYSTGSFIQGFTNAQINAGGATIDTQNYSVTIPQALLAPIGNGVTSIALTSGGAGYVGAPVIKISGGGGAGATAVSEWDAATKTVTGIKVTSPGFGYTSAPTVSFATNSGGFAAEATLGAVSTGPITSGGLTKKGSGTLTLSGTNTYTGTTTVLEGTLRIFPASLASSTLTVADGATLHIPASATESITLNTVTLGTATGASLDFSMVASTEIPPLDVAGALTVEGTSTINIRNTLFTSGSFPLVQYDSLAGSGAFALGPLPQGVQATLTTNVTEKIIYLTVSSVDTLVWDGDVSAVWDIAGVANWKNSSSSTLQYQESPTPDTVRFDDTATGSGAVTLNATVSPGHVTVDSTSKPYTLTGSGGIAGSTPLVKSGTATLTLATANTYTGPTTVNSGTLQVGAGGTVGSLGSGEIINNGTLTYNRSDNQTWAQTISGTGNLVKSGTADTSTLTLGTPNSYAGGTTITKGILQVNNSLALGAGPISLSGARRLSLGNGVVLTNDLTLGTNVGENGTGLIHASAGTPELRGRIMITGGVSAGGHFSSATGSELILRGAITSELVTVSFRTGAATFSGGGFYTNLFTTGTIRLGALNGISTNAVVSVGVSGAGVLNLNSFSQTFAGLTRVNSSSSLTNSSGTTASLTNNVQTGRALTFNSPVIGKINLAKWGGGQQTFSGTTNAINRIDVKQGSLALNGFWNNTGTFYVGGDTPNTATLKIQGGALYYAGDAYVGANNIIAPYFSGLTGQVIQTSGAIVSVNAIRTATDTNVAWASYTMSGGSIDLTSTVSSYLLIGRNGRSTFDQSGGTVTVARARSGTGSSVTDSAFIIAFDTTSYGQYTLSGGTLSVTNGGFGTVIGINNGSQGFLTLTNSGIANLWSTIVANNTGANGTINMNGGELRFVTLKGGSGNRALKWSAGTIRPLTSNTLARIESTLAVTLISSNGVFSTQDALDNEAILVADSIIGELGASYGFEKKGAGNLLLTKANTYSGPTVVTFGTLFANNTTGSATGSGAVTVRTGAVLGGTGSCAGAVSIATGGGINPGTTNTTPSTLTVGSLTFQANSTNTLDCVVATATCDKVTVTGALTIQGAGHVALSYTGETPPSKMLIGSFNTVSGAENLSNWTVSGTGINPAIQKYKVFVEGSNLYVGDRRGTLISFK